MVLVELKSGPPQELSELELVNLVNQEHDRCQQAYRSALHHARRAGEILLKLKAARKHGEWLSWLAEHCTIPERTAQTYMRVAREWNKLEESATVADLSLRDAITLLSEPGDEIQVVEADLIPAPVKPSGSGLQLIEGEAVEVAAPANLFHGQTVEVLERRGDVYVCKTPNGVEYPFLPGELKQPVLTEGVKSPIPQPQPQPQTPKPQPQPLNPHPLDEADYLRSLLQRVYEVAGAYLPVGLLSEVKSAIQDSEI